MMRQAVSVLLVLMLAACSGAAVQEEEPSPLPKFKPQATLAKLWSASSGAATKQRVILQPAVVGERVVVADRKGQVTAYAVGDGREIWRRELEMPLAGGIGAVGDSIFLGTLKGEVLCLAAADGKERWRAQVSSEVVAPPRGEGDLVMVQTVDAKLFALAAASGKQIWTHERSEPALTLRGTGAPAVTTGAIYAAFATGKIAGFKRADGTLLWEAALADPHGRDEVERLVDIDTPPLYVGEVLYAGGYQGKVAALQPASGSVIWARDISTYLALDHDDTQLFVVDDKSNVLALDLNGGATKWKQDKLRGRNLSAPRVFDKHVAIGDADGYVHVLRRDNGEFVARYSLGDAIAAQPTAHTGRLIVLDQDGELVVLQVKAQRPS